MSRLCRDERGVAALELGILLSLLLLVAFGALPLYAMLRSYQRVSKASAATLRYATSVSANGHVGPSGTLTRRPSYEEIKAFARDAANDDTVDVVVTVCRGATCTAASGTTPIAARSGDTVKLTVRTTVDLRLLGSTANAVSRLSGDGPKFPENDVTISATAAAREE